MPPQPESIPCCQSTRPTVPKAHGAGGVCNSPAAGKGRNTGAVSPFAGEDGRMLCQKTGFSPGCFSPSIQRFQGTLLTGSQHSGVPVFWEPYMKSEGLSSYNTDNSQLQRTSVGADLFPLSLHLPEVNRRTLAI